MVCNRFRCEFALAKVECELFLCSMKIECRFHIYDEFIYIFNNYIFVVFFVAEIFASQCFAICGKSKKNNFLCLFACTKCFHRELKNFRKRDLLQEYEPASFKIKDFIFMILEKIFINIKNDQGHIS